LGDAFSYQRGGAFSYERGTLVQVDGAYEILKEETRGATVTSESIGSFTHPDPEIPNPKLETRNPNPEIPNPNPKT